MVEQCFRKAEVVGSNPIPGSISERKNPTKALRHCFHSLSFDRSSRFRYQNEPQIAVKKPIRIISDIHFGHRGSLIHHPDQIDPLLKDTSTLVFNGDTFEAQFKDRQEDTHTTMEELKRLCSSNQVTPHFISGNHDPGISDLHYITLNDEEILITHGDILFQDIVPWSPHAKRLSLLHRKYLDELTEAEKNDFSSLLQANKKASLNLNPAPPPLTGGIMGKLKHFAGHARAPQRVYRTFSSWINTPGIATNFLQKQCPKTQFFIFGHTHFPGIWSKKNRVIINTGSFVPLLGNLSVDIFSDRMSIRKIRMRKGQAHLGREIASFKI